MSTLQILIFLALLTYLLGRGLARPARFFEFPYFMAATFLVFILPQVISLKRFPGPTPLESLTPVMVMTNLCLAGCFFGYLLPPSRWIARKGGVPVSLPRLFHVAIVFVAVSYFFTYLIHRMNAEETGGSMWTGRVTIYLFFSQLVFPGLGIALFTALSRRSFLAWCVTLWASLIPLHAIVLAGRRESAALFLLTIGVTLFYHRRWAPPRTLVAAALAFAMLAIPATATYRSVMQRGGVHLSGQVDLVGNFRRFLNEESILELRNAAVLIYATRSRGDYEYGTAYWDQIVFRFIPAQIFGREFKERLMFKRRIVDPAEKDEAIEIGTRRFANPRGSTVTGMGDAFQQFGYAGCLFFVVMALVFRSLWETSLQPHTFFAKLLYIQTSTSAMRAVTHQTSDFLPGLLYNLVFLGLAVLYAYSPRSARTRFKGGLPGPAPETDATLSPGRPTAEGRPFLAPAKKRDVSELE